VAAPTFTGTVANVILPSPKDLPSVGGIYWGPLAAAVPDSAFTIASTMKHLGFIGAEGFDDKEDRSVKAIYDWGGDTIANPQDSFGKTATFTLLEFLNPDVAKFAYKTVERHLGRRRRRATAPSWPSRSPPTSWTAAPFWWTRSRRAASG
jgi:hypothetical protein